MIRIRVLSCVNVITSLNLREVNMRKVVIGIVGAVTLLLAGMLAGNAEAQLFAKCCSVNGVWTCGYQCAHPQAPRCCKVHGKKVCPCPPQ